MSKEELIYCQRNEIAVLKSDNQKMVQGLQLLEDELKQLKNICMDQEKTINEKHVDIVDQKKINKRL